MGPVIHSADWVVPVATPPLRDGAVCVDQTGTILAVGAADELLRAFPDATHQHTPGTLLPALVNAHTHIELSALAQRVPGGDDLVAWVGRLMRATAEVSDDERLASAQSAVASLWQLGTAAVGDVGNQLVSPQALGTRPLQGSFFHEILGSQDKPGGNALATAREGFAAMAKAGTWPAGFAYVQAPHAPYSASADLLKRLFRAAASEGQATSLHVAEDKQELELLLRGEGAWCEVLTRLGVDPQTRAPGLGPLPYLQSLGAFAGEAPPLLVHMCHAGAEDLRVAAAHKTTAVLCVRSNLHITNQLPNVPALLQAGVPLALGTDSLASNTSLSLWDEMAALANRFAHVPASVWLTAATTGGAHALQRPHLGALVPGKSPGLIAVDLRDAEPIAALVHARPANVTWIVEPSPT